MKPNTEMTNYGSHAQHAAELLPLAGLQHWQANPRHENESEVDALMTSLRAVGQLDDVHVWRWIDGDRILRGNRRVAAMRELGWSACRQVVHEFEDERDAYRFLLEDHAAGRVVALTAEEKIVSVENGVRMGMSVDEIAPSMGVNEKLTQLYFDLGKNLPVKARDALGDGRMGLTVAALLLKIPDAKQRDEAARKVLAFEGDGEPMPYKQAKAMIEMNWLLPAKYEAEWAELCVSLKKKFSVVEGYVYVPWKEREDYVMGWRGNAEPGYEYGDVPMPSNPDGRTWEQVAREMQVPVYICPAPEAKTGFVRLVHVRMLKEALAADKKPEVDVAEGRCAPLTVVDGGRQDDDEEGEREMDDALGAWLREMLEKIYQALLANPTVVMTKEPWLPLQSYLANLVTDVDAGAFQAWTGITTAAKVQEWIAGDKKNRASLRTTLMLLLCAESDASSQPEKAIREVATVLEVEVGTKNVQDQATANEK